METIQGIQLLTNTFKDQDWFCNVGTDEQNRYVVYTSSMSLKVLTSVPSDLEGKQVLVHFAPSKPKFNVIEPKTEYKIPLAMDNDFEAGVVVSVVNDSSFLLDELDRLEDVCDWDVLSDIFYEIIDREDAVTNLSSEFPKVRESLEKLYNEFGFTALHDEIDY